MLDIDNSTEVAEEERDVSNISDVVAADAVSNTIEVSPKKNLLLSCMIGNALEWYDFVIYGYCATIFGFLFFPNSDPVTQILASWGVFWSGFLARPLGAAIFGHIGDKMSRKQSLAMAIYLMAIPTCLMGLLPTYSQIGVTATILLVVFRTLQGLAIGGEFTGSMVFLVEHAPKHKRGSWGSWVSFSAVLGVVIGSILVASLNSTLSDSQMYEWGWRVPFILSVVGSSVGAYMRKNLDDPEVYLEVKDRQESEHTPLRHLFTNYKKNMGLIVLIDFMTAIGFFIIAIFLATYFKNYIKVSPEIAFNINSINMLVFAGAILAGGRLLDRFRTLNVLIYPCIGFILISYPLFYLMSTKSVVLIMLSQGIFACMFGVFFGALPSVLISIMPTSVRCSGLSISHNLSMAIFGGSAPFVATKLIESTGNIASPSYLLIIAAALSVAGLSMVKKVSSINVDRT